MIPFLFPVIALPFSFFIYAYAVFAVLVLSAWRLYAILPIHKRPLQPPPPTSTTPIPSKLTIPPSSKTKTLIILGSGGHTTEMFRLLRSVDKNRYSPRVYYVADTDKMSAMKARSFEVECGSTEDVEFTIKRIPRSREVKQSFFTSIFTTVKALLFAFEMLTDLPDLILCNGPGTCVPLLMVAYIPRFFGRPRFPRIVYVESFARVHSLSLTGKLVYPFVDKFIVQWPQLLKKYDKAEYYGKSLVI